MQSPDILALEKLASNKGWEAKGNISNGFETNHVYILSLKVPSKDHKGVFFTLEVSLLSKTDTVTATDWKLSGLILLTGITISHGHFLYQELDKYLSRFQTVDHTCPSNQFLLIPREPRHARTVQNVYIEIMVLLKAADSLWWMTDYLKDAVRTMSL